MSEGMNERMSDFFDVQMCGCANVQIVNYLLSSPFTHSLTHAFTH